MKILALEFSSPQRSVTALEGQKGAELRLGESIESGGQATNALGMIESALSQAQLEREQIQCIAVGLGPGSYTGIRAAIALAQGWQLARPVKLLGISSIDCLAAQAQAEGLTGRVDIVIDAQREEFYLAGFEIGPDRLHETDPLHITSLAEVQKRHHAGGIILGPEIRRWIPTAHEIFPRAAWLARLALGRTDFTPGEKLEPIYLREVKFVKAPPPRILPR
jgi:tRNA threonylcarbamoyl adenosine modification protein YeaZ